MRIGFYPKLAWDGIRKNKRMYLPYILACIGMVMMTYIITHLHYSDTISSLPGGDTIGSLMNIGMFVLAIFSAIFLFYTNSFLIRRRMKEFGLYNILGMKKNNISAILVWETFFVAAISIGAGLFLGVSFSKLIEVGFVNLLNGKVTYTLSVSFPGIFLTALMFGAIFLLLLLNTLRRIWFSNTISLLRSENTGEKPPKANWFFGILGILVLAAAYYLAVTIKDPIEALGMFFVAVIMVIIATYLIMIAGSVLFCRILQKKKGYYYKPNHFVSVSSMVYRMKRNGAGLASICILATMVLVMIATTSAMYIGSEDVIREQYPRGINTWVSFPERSEFTDEKLSDIRAEIDKLNARRGTSAKNIIDYRTVRVQGILKGETIVCDTDEIYDYNILSSNETYIIHLVWLEDYNKMTGQNVSLAEDEALIYSNRTKYKGDVIGFVHSRHYKIKEHLTECFQNRDTLADIRTSIMLIVADPMEASKGLIRTDGVDPESYPNGYDLCDYVWNYCFDTSLDDEGEIALHREILKSLSMMSNPEEGTGFAKSVRSLASERSGYYAMYGGIFYLAVILSVVFIFAAVLIIYYKQLSEGYEDQSRFEIMQKVGMTRRDIRKSINSQLLTVFFLPLIGAGMHLTFAFPIIEKLLLLFNLSNRTLFICTALGSFLVFALFYAIVYRITSNAYYNIVSGAKKSE